MAIYQADKNFFELPSDYLQAIKFDLLSRLIVITLGLDIDFDFLEAGFATHLLKKTLEKFFFEQLPFLPSDPRYFFIGSEFIIACFSFSVIFRNLISSGT